MSGDVVKVHLSDDYYLHEQFDTDPRHWSSQQDVYEVPAEQVARWEAARDAWADAQEEMHALMSARSEQRRAEREERDRREAEIRARQEARRAEIRADLYGGRKR